MIVMIMDNDNDAGDDNDDDVGDNSIYYAFITNNYLLLYKAPLFF